MLNIKIEKNLEEFKKNLKEFNLKLLIPSTFIRSTSQCVASLGKNYPNVSNFNIYVSDFSLLGDWDKVKEGKGKPFSKEQKEIINKINIQIPPDQIHLAADPTDLYGNRKEIEDLMKTGEQSSRVKIGDFLLDVAPSSILNLGYKNLYVMSLVSKSDKDQTVNFIKSYYLGIDDKGRCYQIEYFDNRRSTNSDNIKLLKEYESLSAMHKQLHKE